MAGEYRFSFGPWNIHEGGDPFGPTVRDTIAFAEKLKQYKSLGFDGVLFGGGSKLLVNQLIAIGATFAFSFIVTWVVAKILDATIGLRVSTEDELVGLDQSQHAESAYQ